MSHNSSISVVLGLHNLLKANGTVTPAKTGRMAKGPVEEANVEQLETEQVPEGSTRLRSYLLIYASINVFLNIVKLIEPL